MANQNPVAAEFEQLPIELFVAQPIIAAAKAHAAAADATRMYIEQMLEPDTRRPRMLELTLEHKDEDGQVRGSRVSAPLLTLSATPTLGIESLDVKFKYEVSQVVRDSHSTGMSLELGASTGAALSPWVDASLRGTVSTQSAEESSTNRSGCLEIHVRAAALPVSDGMAKLLTLLSNNFSVTPVPAPAPPSPRRPRRPAKR